VAGTGITISGATGAVTVNATGTGTVTSVATGNGLSGGTITSTGTLVVACPTFNTVGSYCMGGFIGNSSGVTSGSNYSAGGTNSSVQSAIINSDPAGATAYLQNNLSGTWKWMGGTQGGTVACQGLFCRVS